MKTYIVDSFTDIPYRGNPAGVCLADQELSDSMMLKIAREINLSETAFLLKRAEGYFLRWFTPATEVKLCGHATLATAHILYETGVLDRSEKVAFSTMSGVLTAAKRGGLIELNFPQQTVSQCDSNDIIEQAFGVRSTFTAKNDDLYLLEVTDVELLKSINPDFQLLKQADRGEFIITSGPCGEYDFYSRLFAPGLGINEDPVTGSAHCILAPYWSGKLGKRIMKAFQASERTGSMECELIAGERVLLRGMAVTINEFKNNWIITK